MGEILISSPSCTAKPSSAFVTLSWLLFSGISRRSIVRLSWACTRSTSMWRSVPVVSTPPDNSSTSARFFSPCIHRSRDDGPCPPRLFPRPEAEPRPYPPTAIAQPHYGCHAAEDRKHLLPELTGFRDSAGVSVVIRAMWGRPP